MTNPLASPSSPKAGRADRFLKVPNLGITIQALAMLFVFWNALIMVPQLQIARENVISGSPLRNNGSWNPSLSQSSSSFRGQRQKQQQESIVAHDSSPQVSHGTTLFIDDNKNIEPYAAAWWQSIERFVQCPLEKIITLEDATYVPINEVGKGQDDAYFTVDYLDFMVEHLSKWFKWPDNDAGLAYATGRLQSATEQMVRNKQSSSSSLVMQSTLAVMPLVSNSQNPVYLRTLQEALAATMTSLLQQGVGRIVLVGHFENDAILARNAFLQLQMLYEQTENVAEEVVDSTLPFQVDLSRKVSDEHSDVLVQQLAFVHAANAESKLLPKAALKGLQSALQGKVDGIGQLPETWLGSRSTPQAPWDTREAKTTSKTMKRAWSPWDWEYIYFTEPDQILNARLTPSFTEAMDGGGIVLPHRLQPIPHISDLVGITNEQLVPINKFIQSLDLREDACCDVGPSSATGITLAQKADCSAFWWQCNYEKGSEHMQNYDLIRVTTGVVHVAADEHSRRCRPVKGGRGTCTDVTDISEDDVSEDDVSEDASDDEQAQ